MGAKRLRIIAAVVGVIAAVGFVGIMASRQEAACDAELDKVRALIDRGSYDDARRQLDAAETVCRSARLASRKTLHDDLNKANGGPQLDAAERAAGIARTFTPRYEKQEVNRTEFMGNGKPVARVSWTVSVPQGLSRQELEENVRHALLLAAESERELGAARVYAMPDKSNGADTLATGVFAPKGAWAAADPDVAIGDWRATITVLDESAPKAAMTNKVPPQR